MSFRKIQLKEFTPQAANFGRPIIGFASDGSIRISKAACCKLKLKKGDRISFLQDQERTADWYIKVHEQGAFEVKFTTENNGRIHHVPLLRAFKESLDLSSKSFAIPVGEFIEGLGVWSLVTLVAKRKERDESEF